MFVSQENELWRPFLNGDDPESEASVWRVTLDMQSSRIAFTGFSFKTGKNRKSIENSQRYLRVQFSKENS